MKTFHKGEDITLNLNVSPYFRGILRGFAHDISEGCTLDGTLIMNVHHPTKIKRLETKLSGQARVNFRTYNSMGVPTTDGQEERMIYLKINTYVDQTKAYEPGTYCFPFTFHIPPTVPHTLNSKYGQIYYTLNATASRTVLKSDVHVEQPIFLRRCLMDDLNPVAPATQTIVGKMHPEIVSYSATAPSMVYAEGGLLTLNFQVHLKDFNKYSVRTVTCGLQENQYFRTTGRYSLTNQAAHYNKSFFPLGCSTFFPSKHPEYNPAELHHYNALFRLYPRVQTDNKSKLIAVQHQLVICMIIDDNEVAKTRSKRKRSIDSISNSISNISIGNTRSILSHLTSKQQPDRQQHPSSSFSSPSSEASADVVNYTPPLSRSPSPILELSGERSRDSSPSFAFETEQQTSIVKVTSKTLSVNDQQDNNNSSTSMEDNDGGHSLTLHHHLNPFKFYKNYTEEEGAYECRLTIPITVTSREEYREGSVPALPDYDSTADQPPNYISTIQSLPPVPIYPSNEAS